MRKDILRQRERYKVREPGDGTLKEHDKGGMEGVCCVFGADSEGIYDDCSNDDVG